jgi:hypothetical protein
VSALIGTPTGANQTVPYGTGQLRWGCSRHFVPRYDRTVPPGLKAKPLRRNKSSQAFLNLVPFSHKCYLCPDGPTANGEPSASSRLLHLQIGKYFQVLRVHVGDSPEFESITFPMGNVIPILGKTFCARVAT